MIINKGSPYCSIQSKPRTGYGAYGFPGSGPMDSRALRGVNYLLGNAMWAPCLEIMVKGPEIQFTEHTFMAVVGASVELSLNQEKIKSEVVYQVGPGDKLKFGRFHYGIVAYLAVAGGFEVDEVLGSGSTLLSLGWGQLVEKGTKIRIPEPPGTLPERVLPNFLKVIDHQFLTLRTIPGPEASEFDELQIDLFYKQKYQLTNDLSRMGFRLAGEKSIAAKTGGIISSGVVKGTIQIPASGEPIIMMPDHQTAGGYPRIANVITHDIELLSQARPGTELNFREISVEKAVEVLRTREEKISRLFHH